MPEHKPLAQGSQSPYSLRIVSVYRIAVQSVRTICGDVFDGDVFDGDVVALILGGWHPD